MNSTPNSNFYTLYSRLGVDVAGPKLGTAKTSAKVEVASAAQALLIRSFRLRHAYFESGLGENQLLLLGQTGIPYSEMCLRRFLISP